MPVADTAPGPGRRASTRPPTGPAAVSRHRRVSCSRRTATASSSAPSAAASAAGSWEPVTRTARATSRAGASRSVNARSTLGRAPARAARLVREGEGGAMRSGRAARREASATSDRAVRWTASSSTPATGGAGAGPAPGAARTPGVSAPVAPGAARTPDAGPVPGVSGAVRTPDAGGGAGSARASGTRVPGASGGGGSIRPGRPGHGEPPVVSRALLLTRLSLRAPPVCGRTRPGASAGSSRRCVVGARGRGVDQARATRPGADGGTHRREQDRGRPGLPRSAGYGRLVRGGHRGCTP